MENNNTIIFRMGEETGIVIEKTKEQFEHSLFREQYKQAFSIMDSILFRTTKVNPNDEIDENISNVIAFCGDRGEGKTSALETVRGILSSKKIMKEAQAAKFYSSDKIDFDSFKVLRLIDPAFFDSKHNLLELLIGQMYADICDDDKRKMEEGECSNRCDENIANRNRLMEKFQKVKRSLAIINKASDKNAYDDLEEIDDLAAGIELKNIFNELLHCYARYFHKERVLISIDDLDLNATEGYQMAEEIRKYLSSPEHCVVLLAVKIEQMIEVVQSYLREHLSSIILKDTIEDMATRYVTKLLPQNHRVWMPTGSILADSMLHIYEGNTPVEIFPSVKEAVVRLIFRKTRYIFVNSRNVSPIVPGNLRELRHLWATLWGLQDGEKNDENHIKNKSIFKHYFYNIWVKQLGKDIDFATSLVQNQDPVSINKSIVTYLGKKYANILGVKYRGTSGAQERTLLSAILEPSNPMQNVSTGDVLYLINAIEGLTADEMTHKLLFFIKAFYSITLYESYDIATIDEEHLYPSIVNHEVSIYKYDRLYRKLNALQRVVNGSYFTYNPEDVLPREKNTQKARDIRNYDPKHLRDIYDELIKGKAEKMSDYDINLNTLEFFALTTTDDVYADNGQQDKRSLSSPVRITNIRPKANMVSFDVLSIFYNIINLKHTYERWNEFFKVEEIDEKRVNSKSEEEWEKEDEMMKQKPSLFELAVSEPNSLYNKMMRECTDYSNRNYTSQHYLISNAAIRFADVQLAIMDLALNNKNTHHVPGNKHNIRLLYKDIQELGISLYPIKEGESRYELKFEFLTPIIRFLKDIDNESFDEIFSSAIENSLTKGDMKILIKVFSLMATRLILPALGDDITKQIGKHFPNFYKACGGAKYWRKVIEKERTYTAADELAAKLISNKVLRDTLLNNASILNEELGITA